MKRTCMIAVLALAVLAMSIPAMAVPKLQTYAVGATYQNNYMGSSEDSWVTQSQSFDLKVVGSWGSSRNANKKLKVMDTWLVVGVVKGETGSIAINGVQLTSFNTSSAFNASGSFYNGPMGAMEVRYYHIGAINNSRKRSFDYSKWGTYGPYYGDEITMNVKVEGFSYVHFDAVGKEGNRTYKNWSSRDASYHNGKGGGNNYANPEPGTLTLLGTGLLGLIPVLRRKRRQKNTK